MNEHKIEFEEGEVIRPEFSPENDLEAIYVSDAGLESLRESVCLPDGGDKAILTTPTPAEGFMGEVIDLAERYRAAGVAPAVIAPALRSVAGRYEAIEGSISRLRQRRE